MILVCEPECRGVSHLKVNTALISYLREIYLAEKIVFYAEGEHARAVQEEMEPSVASSISFIPVNPPDPTIPYRMRKKLDHAFVHELLKGCNEDDLIVFLSCTSTNLRALKKQLSRIERLRAVVVVHGILRTLAKRRPPFPGVSSLWNLLEWFGFHFLFGNNKIMYFVLGESIRKNLLKLYPWMKRYVESIDHPFLFNKPIYRMPFANNIVNIGHLGIASRSKGSANFVQLAKENYLSGRGRQLVFRFVGHINDSGLETADCVILPNSGTPLSQEYFDSLAMELDYAAYFYPRHAYDLVASGAFFDAFSYRIPIIALKNSFFEYYFQKFGDIGFLCENITEMRKVLDFIRMEETVDHYKKQQKAIDIARKELSSKNFQEKIVSFYSDWGRNGELISTAPQ